MGDPIILWKVLIVWVGFVSYFCCEMSVVEAMPHHEPGHHHDGHQTGNQYYNNNPGSEMMEGVDLAPLVVTNDGASDIVTTPELETTAETASESEPTTSTDDAEGELVNATKASTTTIEFVQNKISRPSSSGEEDSKQQQEVEENVVEDAGGYLEEQPQHFPFNNIPPTMAVPSLSSPPTSLPLLPPASPVIDPISLQDSASPDENGAKSVAPNDSTVSSTSESFFADSLPIVEPGASSPSLQLIPPPPTKPSYSTGSSPLSPDIPREPDQGELPESPEPHSIHPFNLHDLPISLVSLSGNSGGSTSDMATFSSLVSPSPNVPLDFTKVRYHVVTGQLFKIGSTGPGICPENMRFFAVPGHPKNGACDCDYYQCSRPLIYSPEMHQCYWAWSQGPCDKEEWFVFDKDLRRRGKCEKNPCPASPSLPTLNDTATVSTAPHPSPSSALEYYFQNPKDNACYQAGTQGYCGDADERLLIYPGEPIPKCRKFTVCYPLTVPQELQCVYGNKYFVESGQCQ